MEGLTPDRLVALVDELRARGVTRFGIGSVSVEFAPQAVQAALLAQAESARAPQDYRLAEAAKTAAQTKEAAEAAQLARAKAVLASA